VALSGNSLEVDPQWLRRAASELSNHCVELRCDVRGIDQAHETLQQSWSGAAARLVAEAWDQLHPAVDGHMAILGDHAERLNSSAESYLRQDDSNAASYDQ
jgi:WXG100 family type VII secretion target